MDIITFPIESILLHGVILLPAAMSYDNNCESKMF